MSRLDANAEGDDGDKHRAAGHLAHRFEQAAGESQAVEESEKERRAQPAPSPGTARPKHVLNGNEDDAGGDERLNDLLRGRINKFSLDALVTLASRAGLAVRLDVQTPAAA